MRKAFTLIELMISIVILSILMLFLYKSYSSLNRSNQEYAKELQKIHKVQKIKKTMYLDFTLCDNKSVKILNQNQKEDIVFMHTSHSIHNRIEPYVAYIVKDMKLYRLESLKVFKTYPLSLESEYDVDFIGKIIHFRVYKNDVKVTKLKTIQVKYLLDCDFKELSDVLFKLVPLNRD